MHTIRIRSCIHTLIADPGLDRPPAAMTKPGIRLVKPCMRVIHMCHYIIINMPLMHMLLFNTIMRAGRITRHVIS